MAKMIKIICVVAIGLFTMPQSANAQFFKKLKKAAENVVKEVTKVDSDDKSQADKNASPALNFITSASGVSIGNPASKHFDLEFVSAVGNKASNTVTITLKATAKSLNYSDVWMGKFKVVGYDTDGNEYNRTRFSDKKNLTVGLPVKFELAPLEKVPATVTTLSVVYSDWFISTDSGMRSVDGNLSTLIQLKNVPVTWE